MPGESTRSRSTSALARAIVLLVSSGSLASQSSWTDVSGHGNLSSPAVTVDPTSGDVLWFGGASKYDSQSHDWTLSWRDGKWQRLHPTNSPPAQSGASMVTDSLRRRVVLIGGSETWVWDGVVWAKLSTAVSPPSAGPATYDSTRDRVVMVTGDQTWEFDGSSWAQVGSGLPPRLGLSWIAYDASRGQTVFLFRTTSGQLQTWEWDGAAWTPRAGAVTALTDRGPLAYDVTRGRVVCVTLLSDFFEWDGTAWLAIPIAPAPDRPVHLVAYPTRQTPQMVLVASKDSAVTTWEWDGQGWALADHGLPAPTGCVALDTQRGSLVLHGGSDGSRAPNDETWEWDGERWERRVSLLAPMRAGDQGMAFDKQRGVCVMLGGGTASSVIEEQWEWDGTNWSLFLRSPGPRTGYYRHKVTYDDRRGQILALDVNAAPPILWTFDGATWRQDTALVPTFNLYGTALAFDSSRGCAVLADSAGSTFEWDGTSWSAGPAPPGRTPLAYDSIRQRVLGFGNGATWEWDGTSWTSRGGAPPLGYNASWTGLQFDGRRILFSTYLRADQYHAFEAEDPPAVEPLGPACSGAGIALAATSYPWLGDPFGLSVTGIGGGGVAGLLLGVPQRPSLPLAGFGMPGCGLHVQILVGLPLAVSAGQATVAAPIPTSASLIGAEFAQQAYAVEPGFNPLGVVVSNGLLARIGSR